ncbi:MAG: biotin--[acetyl-CoA-carboxylase] ligase [Isosphaeraceae bacterium]
MNSSFIHTIVEREEVGSTSDLARSLLEGGGVELPLLVRADRQTAGRGRGAHSWWSDEGSLAITIGLDPETVGLRPEHGPRLALASAVALVDAVSPLIPKGMAPGIRWPNDVEVGGRKLAGTLPERIETATGPKILIGIGLNVSTRLENAPEAVRLMATTVEALRPPWASPLCPSDLLGPFLDRFAAALEALTRDDEALAEQWSQLDTLIGRRVRVDLGPRIIVGTGRGIDRQGGLRLETEGETITLLGGQVLRDRL